MALCRSARWAAACLPLLPQPRALPGPTPASRLPPTPPPAAWREWLVAAVRLVAVACITATCACACQRAAALPHAERWVMLWRLTGAESLCVTAVGFRTRTALHLSLQLAALAVAGWRLPAVCSEVSRPAPGAC